MRISRQKAFTLVEVLASVLILAGVVVVLILCMADGLFTSWHIEQRAKSALLAECEIEKIKSVLAESFETDFTSWPAEIADGYLAVRTATVLSNTLKLIHVSVGHDINADSMLGADEIMVTLVTQNVKRN